MARRRPEIATGEQLRTALNRNWNIGRICLTDGASVPVGVGHPPLAPATRPDGTAGEVRQRLLSVVTPPDGEPHGLIRVSFGQDSRELVVTRLSDNPDGPAEMVGVVNPHESIVASGSDKSGQEWQSGFGYMNGLSVVAHRGTGATEVIAPIDTMFPAYEAARIIPPRLWKPADAVAIDAIVRCREHYGMLA